ncbi:MAG: hypothetical protein A2504_11400 [Bdellovibrionales bacterium RIFOXYD12_FULL_39_22]|nr:MAG: hypothetical protein A2385_09965 [Bdellovibrionales bacterium RIFOXYB1_FULL_39_21]OFZ44277.1 MAG: hypothetical protein A2485_07585 [Bdellovibrionales bacterium RIFOXYC12_FULL_39_17]OFZ46819.1 MAG: hypothetical protein A2404_04820 [Bdellovibrionales bacterium RIFOXYC1_FULL_39_130]OFZ75904.1 MAG: hypothetical protein A2560_02330 [Bdellovibrionales bacterium RIFOXYD1_FULL_39_84]OFZ95498.1 MAG: hypothetical protein A2504_11400 [Bdellovibrionales bacterium RIFOXYD12_FULL_39_22]HLE09763.1 AB
MRTFIFNFRPYISQHWTRIIGSIVLSFALAGIKGYQIYLVRPIFDKGLAPNATFRSIFILASLLLALSLINFPIRFLHFYWIRFVEERVMCDLRLKLMAKFQRLPMSYYSTAKQGKLISALTNDTTIIAQGLRAIIDIIREPVTAIIMLGVAMYHDWQLTLVMLIVTPLFLAIFIATGKKLKRTQEVVQEDLAIMAHNATEGIMGQKISKAFNLQNYIILRFHKAQELFFKSKIKTTFIEEFTHPLVEVVGALAFSGVIVFAHFRITSGQLSTGGFVSFVAALAMVMDPIRKYSQANVKLSQATAGGDRVFSLLALDEEIDRGQLMLDKFHHSIELKNVTFSYGEGAIIKNLSLTINKGQKVALIGLSGSGKSTIINLLLGLYPINSGEILIDGHPIGSIKLQSLRKIFGLVSQDIFLFNDTIRENLQVGKNISDKDLQRALKISYADNFIRELPRQLDTVIGDRGTRLSGGQQQRLTIARAFLQNNDVLLFDEATSALDNESEKIVQQALEELAQEKTVVAVAHRLSTIQNYDQIYVLKAGELIEQGTHSTLMANNSDYARLYELSQKV